MNPLLVRAPLFAIGVLVTPAITVSWISDAEQRLEEAEASPEEADVAIASASDEGYCNANLKKVLRRVLQSCGLLSSGDVRGCQPLEAKNVATMQGDDFNALFLPLEERAGIIQFGKEDSELDAGDEQMLAQVFADQRGASYFFVVARSSPEGSEQFNRELSEKRGKAVLSYLQATFPDPDLEKEVGLLWLGEEYAQLHEDFCTWTRSGEECTPADLNRSAFVAWIDCQL
jgi:outer membrane protein OmpA-like peptidoglycan-associated protein